MKVISGVVKYVAQRIFKEIFEISHGCLKNKTFPYYQPGKWGDISNDPSV